MYDFRKWTHVFKLDPNKPISEENLEKICDSGTDAIIVGGSDGVTLDNVLHLLSRVRRFSVPCVLEVSTLDAITPGFDMYFIPTVLNSNNPDWILGKHHEAIKKFSHFINWKEAAVEGYCILNEDSKVARMTNAATNLDVEDVAAYAVMAENMFRLPIFYIEYSGKYGDPKLVAKAKRRLERTVLFYGGGISSAEQAAQMKESADCIVVGNIIYENINEAIATVKAVKKEIDSKEAF